MCLGTGALMRPFRGQAGAALLFEDVLAPGEWLGCRAGRGMDRGAAVLQLQQQVRLGLVSCARFGYAAVCGVLGFSGLEGLLPLVLCALDQ